MAEKDAADFLGEDVFKKLDDNKKEVVVDMAYNMGLPKLSEFKKFKATIKMLTKYNPKGPAAFVKEENFNRLLDSQPLLLQH